MVEPSAAVTVKKPRLTSSVVRLMHSPALAVKRPRREAFPTMLSSVETLVAGGHPARLVVNIWVSNVSEPTKTAGSLAEAKDVQPRKIPSRPTSLQRLVLISLSRLVSLRQSQAAMRLRH